MKFKATVQLPYYGRFDETFPTMKEARDYVARLLAGSRLGKAGEFGSVARLSRNNHWWKIIQK